uniref:Uncharacterized protein n=1 Tax=Aegilops tauschii subsp. strangulata TaxID=200361 RepID=A0A453JEC7_AEGTS
TPSPSPRRRSPQPPCVSTQSQSHGYHPTGRDPAPRPLQILRPPARAGSSNSSAAVRQKEMTKLYKIRSHAHIRALLARADELGRSHKFMLVNLVSLESVRIARESYALLCPLIMEAMFWSCGELDSLSVVAGLSLEIQKLEQDLLPQLMVLMRPSWNGAPWKPSYS